MLLVSMAVAPGQACYVPLRHGKAASVPQGQLDLGSDLGGDGNAKNLAEGQLEPDVVFDACGHYWRMMRF